MVIEIEATLRLLVKTNGIFSQAVIPIDAFCNPPVNTDIQFTFTSQHE